MCRFANPNMEFAKRTNNQIVRIGRRLTLKTLTRREGGGDGHDKRTVALSYAIN